MVGVRCPFFVFSYVLGILFRGKDEDLARDNQLHEEVLQKQRHIGALIRFADLVTLFCSACLVSAWDDVHKVSESAAGAVFRRMSCGRRGPKLQNLRLEFLDDVTENSL